MKKKISYLSPIIGLGGLLGLLEVTLGSFLHLSFMEAGGIFASSSVIMVAIGSFLYLMAYRCHQKASDVIIVGVVAALIKLFAFFIPGNIAMPYKVINPAMSIVFESLAFSLFAVLFKPKKLASFASFGVAFSAGLLWRFAFIGWQETLRATAYWPSLFYGLNKQTGELVLKTTWSSDLVSFLFTKNYLSLLYVAVLLGAALLLQLGFKNKESFKTKLISVCSSPIMAVVLLCGAIVATSLMK